MGHYYSEMNGPPFSSTTNDLSKSIGELILEKNKIKFTTIEKVYIEWINPYSYCKRIWFHVCYKCKEYGKTICFGTYAFKESIKFLDNKQIKEINTELIKENIEL